MGLLDRFFGSDTNLTRPNFDKSENLNFSFSNNKIRIKNAPHTALIPLKDIDYNIDIYNTRGYSKNKEGNYSKNFYTRGWNFFGKGRESKGGVIVSAVVTYDPPDHIADKNNFITDDFYDSILEHCHSLWGVKNRGAELGNLGNGFYQYPTSRVELSTTDINGSRWSKVVAGAKGRAPVICYFSPLTSRHTLFFLFDIEAYRGLDFFSEEINVKDTSFGVVDDFMKHVFIEYSDKAKAELAASQENTEI